MAVYQENILKDEGTSSYNSDIKYSTTTGAASSPKLPAQANSIFIINTLSSIRPVVASRLVLPLGTDYSLDIFLYTQPR